MTGENGESANPLLRIQPTQDLARSESVPDLVASLDEAGFVTSESSFPYLPFGSGAWDLAIHLVSDVERELIDATVSAVVAIVVQWLRGGRRRGRTKVMIFGPDGGPLKEIEIEASADTRD